MQLLDSVDPLPGVPRLFIAQHPGGGAGRGFCFLPLNSRFIYFQKLEFVFLPTGVGP